MTKKLKRWVFSLQGKFILVASMCLLVFTTTGSFLILSREKNLYMQDIINQGRVFTEISRLMLTNVMVYEELGMMEKQDVVDYFDYFIMNLMERDKRIEYAVVFNSKGVVIAHSNISKYGEIVTDKSTLETITNLKTELNEEKFQNDTILKITVPLNIDTKNWGGLQIGLSTRDVQKSINSLKKEIIIINIIFSVLALLIINIGAKVLAKPVIRLTKRMDGIKTYGDFNPQAYELRDRRDEIGELQNSFLWMLQRLREADKEHKKTLEVLSQTEKMVSIGRLASGVAHEINNPLSGVVLCFKNLMESEIEQSKKEQLVGAINNGLQKIKTIIEQLLDFSRMTVTEKAPVELNNLINRLLILLNYSASKKNIRIIKDFSDDIPEILMDENKMTQVFLNIIINALQAMDGGGTLTIKTIKENSYSVISIGDSGTGISSEIMPNIFEPFFTTKGVGEGTGLGLSVSKGIVEQHGGIIDVDSKAGIGTTFTIKLPIT